MSQRLPTKSELLRSLHERRQRSREMFVPLRHDPGHAQVDFGEALASIGGVEQRIYGDDPRN